MSVSARTGAGGIHTNNNVIVININNIINLVINIIIRIININTVHVHVVIYMNISASGSGPIRTSIRVSI